MSMEHLLSVRRAVLKALQAAFPGPLRLDDLLQGLPLMGDSESRREAITELNALVGYGFAENVNNAADPWYRITASGMAQIRQEGKLDGRIWGTLAVG